MSNESGTLVKNQDECPDKSHNNVLYKGVCPSCRADMRGGKDNLERPVLDYNCTHKDKDGEPDVVLAGDSHEECWWECSQCGERLDEEEHKLENPSHEWLNAEAEAAELRAG